MHKPDKVTILGVVYTITYVDNPSEVDIFRRDSLWGQCDYWTRTIRIYDNDRPIEDVWQTLLHEVFHAIAESLHLKSLVAKDAHDDLDCLALGLIDVMLRNGWLAE